MTQVLNRVGGVEYPALMDNLNKQIAITLFIAIFPTILILLNFR